MDIDRGLLVKLLETSDLKKVREAGITPEFFYSRDFRTVFEFILNHARNYGGNVPTADTIFGRTGIKVEGTYPESLDFFIDEAKNRRLHNLLTIGVKNIAEILNERNPQGALERFEQSLRFVRQARLAKMKTESLLASGRDVLEYYEKVKRGERGVLLPWPTMMDHTLGLWPEDLMVFVSRLGIGKTTALIVCMKKAWEDGKRILFISTEMAKIRIAMRFYAIQCQMDYQLIRSGQLGDLLEPRFKEEVEALIHQEGLYIIGGEFNIDFNTIESAIDEVGPNLVILDGLYLIKGLPGENRREIVSNNVEELKRMSKRLSLPFLSSTQFNRQVTKTSKEASAENIATTDVIGWASDYIYGLIQTKEMKEEEKMLFKPLKLREADGKDFESTWSYQRGDFSEIGAEHPTGGSRRGEAEPAGDSSDGEDVTF